MSLLISQFRGEITNEFDYYSKMLVESANLRSNEDLNFFLIIYHPTTQKWPIMLSNDTLIIYWHEKQSIICSEYELSDISGFVKIVIIVADKYICLWK